MSDTYNDSETMQGTTLAQEYDAVFDGDERVSALLKITSDAFTREFRRVNVRQIGLPDPLKKGRLQTMTGLTSTVKDMGVINPIHVMTVSADAEEDDYKYVLLDGLRRMYGAMRNGVDEVDAIVWDFKDKDQGVDLSLFLSLFLNRAQRRNYSEIWDLYKVLELQFSITPGTLEFLLQLESGDAMKLKDVMLCDYEEVKQALINNEKTLEGAYKLLQKLRKEENMLEKEDAMGISATVEGADAIVADNTGDAGELSDNDVVELLDMVNNHSLDDVSSDDFSDLNSSAFNEEHQKVGERHPVDPAIRQGTFQRDKYRCRCCGTGGVAFLATLIYHHAIPVHCGGGDSVENGLTLCDSCHQTLHCAEKAGGKIPMTKEQFEEYSKADQERIVKIINYAKVAVAAAQRKGVSSERIKEEANKSARHRMPGENLKETQAGFLNSGE